MEHLWLFLLLAFVAEVLGTVGGFGSSLFFVPIASFFFDFHTVLGITASFHVISNLTKIGFFRKGFDRRIMFQIGIPAVAGVVAGALLSRYITSAVYEIALALFLIALSSLLFIYRDLQLKPTKLNAISGGGLSGLVAGLFGTGGAVRGLALSAFSLPKDVFIATSAGIDLAVDASRTGVYYLNGYIGKDVLYLLPALLIMSIAGTWAGKRLLTRISEQHFKSIVLALVFLTGVASLISALLN